MLNLIFSLCFMIPAQALDKKASAHDVYSSYSDLALHCTQGEDFNIFSTQRSHSFLVMAIHGGTTEPGTTELAEEIAGSEFSFYSFSALKTEGLDEKYLTRSALHVTSAHFDEPTLKKVAHETQNCLSIHGFGGDEADFCVGGASAQNRKKMVLALLSQYPSLKTCEFCCPPYLGTSSKNPVNFCSHQGVQIEMGPRVRRRILSNESFRHTLATQLKDTFRGFQ